MYLKCILASDVHLPTVVLIVVPTIVPRIVHLGIVHLVSVEIHQTTILFVSLVIVVGHHGSRCPIPRGILYTTYNSVPFL